MCEEALALIEAIRSDGVNFLLTEVNIETSDDLHLAYLERIPVVEVNGREIGELEIEEQVLRAAITSAATMASDDNDD